MRCAVVDMEGNVVNVIVADPVQDMAPDGYTLVALIEGSAVDQDWKFDAQANEFVLIRKEKPLSA